MQTLSQGLDEYLVITITAVLQRSSRKILDMKRPVSNNTGSKELCTHHQNAQDLVHCQQAQEISREEASDLLPHGHIQCWAKREAPPFLVGEVRTITWLQEKGGKGGGERQRVSSSPGKPPVLPPGAVEPRRFSPPPSPHFVER